MNVPENLKYTNTHEWVKILEGGIIEIGLTDYAQEELGDIVFVNLPQAGDPLTAGVSFADVESVKGVSDIFSPINGSVKEINEEILSSPELINKSPYEAWLIRGTGTIAGGELISAAAYRSLLPQE
ncbi:MAG: glycine cleavage system protein GcvH [Spirochaetaceae bacterium]|jgi:glycine cleavage system H protein|nr:glycine cleavage system protein GcvH [Spirochaetaceae bacterium]